jgi:hypothetical protein
MGELSRRVARYGATLALVTLLGVFGAYAEDLFEPPQNRIRPPGGVAASSVDETSVPADPQNRILPPGGVAIRNEVEQGLFDTFWTWLSIQLGVSLPLG